VTPEAEPVISRDIIDILEILPFLALATLLLVAMLLHELARNRWVRGVGLLLVAGWLCGCAAPREAVRIRTELAAETATDLRTAADGVDAMVAEGLREKSDQVFAQIAANFQVKLTEALAEPDADKRRDAVARLAMALGEARAAAHQDLLKWAAERAAIAESVRVGAEAVLAINRMADRENADRTERAGDVASVARSSLDAIIAESEARWRPGAPDNAAVAK
jgi:hypothetical protein